MKRGILVSFGLAGLFFGSAARADVDYGVDFDVSPLLVNGVITTAGLTHEVTTNPWTGQDTTPNAYYYYSPNQRVFAYSLDPTTADTDDPGFMNNAITCNLQNGSTTQLTGTGLPLNSQLYVFVLSDLLYWNDSGTGFTTVPNGESLTFTYGSSVTAGTGTGPLAPLLIKTFSVDSTMHVHIDSQMNGDPQGDAPTNGIYMVQMSLHSSSSAVSDSAPFWAVYNYNDTDLNEEAALNWLEIHAVPEPGSLALLGLGGWALLRKRRIARQAYAIHASRSGR